MLEKFLVVTSVIVIVIYDGCFFPSVQLNKRGFLFVIFFQLAWYSEVPGQKMSAVS